MVEEFSARLTFETQLAALIEQFDRHRAHYLSADYPEAQARIDFIDPLFEALGWDVRNRAGLGPDAREVNVELTGETFGRPDYTFRLDGRIVFFVEAKAPHVPLDRSRHILQAKKYAFNETSRTVLFAAATDFEEFRFYEVRGKPDPHHPNTGLIFAYRYDEYASPTVLDDLWQLSREAVAAGSLDRWTTPAARRERERTPVDRAFLDDLTGWREQLAKAVRKAQPELDASALNNVVQVFLDRLIFIRVAEDRGALPADQLREVARAWREEGGRRPIMADLLPLFRQVNRALNGEIFKPHPCEEIRWDSARVAEIIADGLEPYNFAQIGVELLGSIYERYLGKTIRVTPTRAIVEDKPEVRKAGGVYYTPKYIVDYIVEQTVGKLIEGKTPAQIARLRILDPACGSGSFLLGAYQRLLDHHLEWKRRRGRKGEGEKGTRSSDVILSRREAAAKNLNAETLRGFAAHALSAAFGGGGAPGGSDIQPRLIETGAGEAKLSLEEKAAILRNNLHGVDIDPQAVEITMMSLYIKLLEGERGLIAGRGVLPPLKDNIKCGNSLIGHDVREQPGVTDDDLDRIRPFDWHSPREGFGAIMQAGGFDAVIGNPPYVLLQSLGQPEIQQYLVKKYRSARYKVDTYQVFIEQACLLAKQRGLIGFITPNTFMRNKYAIALRDLLLGSTEIVRLRLFDYRVFAGASVDTVITILRRANKPDSSHIVSLDRTISPSDIQTIGEIGQAEWSTYNEKSFDLPSSQVSRRLLRKIEACSVLLGDFATAYFGIQTHSREKYVQPRPASSVWKPALDGGNIGRYSLAQPIEYVSTESRAIKSGGDSKVYERERIGVRQIGRRPIATLLPGGWYSLNTIYNIYFTRNVDYSLKFVLGLILSGLLGWYWEQHFFDQKQTFPKVKKAPLLSLPIKRIDFTDPADRARHDKMVSLVQRMLDLHKQKASAAGDAARARIEREINVTDEHIDALVYELYGLTKDEIKIVEGAR